MTTTDKTNIAQFRDCWVEGYWLEHSEGFSVESPDGRLGYVAAVDPQHAELIVIGDRGVTRVPLGDIDEVEVAGERLTIGGAR